MLTKRQEQVLNLVAQGLKLRAIAQQLWISTRTVETHLHNIRKRLEANTTPHAVAIYIERKMETKMERTLRH